MGEVDQEDHHPDQDTDLPPSLQRALVDSGDYALRLRTGEVFRFTRAERRGPFAVLFAPGQPATNLVATEPTSDFPSRGSVRRSRWRSPVVRPAHCRVRRRSNAFPT